MLLIFGAAASMSPELMGIIPQIRRDGYEIKELRIVNAQGRRVGGFNVDVFRSATRGRYVTIPRSDLVKNIYEKIDDRCETLFGDAVSDIKQQAGAVDVTFEHSPRRRFDVVIGADGLHSGVRKLAFGDEDHFARFLGYSVAAFEVTGYQPRDDDVYVNYTTPGKQVGRLSLRNDRTLFLFVFADECGPSLLAGQGSALAMIAAYVLAGELGRCKSSPEAALKRYNSLLCPFILSKQRAAVKFASSFTPKTGWGLALRNLASRAFAIPFVARLLMGTSLLDRIDLPVYGQKHVLNQQR